MKSIQSARHRFRARGAILLTCLLGMATGHAQTTTTFNLETATMADVQAAMDADALTSVELVLLYLNRIAAYDQNGIKLNSVPVTNPRVFAEAARADRLRASGVKLGPLQGIPFVAKGNFAFEGIPVTNGLAAWVDLVAPYTCTVIEKLQDAGAVFLGHANLDTFQASTSSSNSETFGLTRNAYNSAYNAGGSSGGPGVSVAANMTFFALGGETGGSVRSPSDRGGIVGFKTSNSTISVHGLAPLAWDRDVVGPMTRYAVDNAAVMAAASGFDPADSWASITLVEGRERPSDFVEKFATGSLAGKKFGVPTNMISTATTGVPIAIKDLFAQARLVLEAAGATVVDVTLPPELTVTFTGRRASVPPEVLVHPTRKLYFPITSDLTNDMVAGSRAYAFKEFLDSILREPGDTEQQVKDKIIARLAPVTQLQQKYKDAIANDATFGPGAPDTDEHFLAVRYQILDYEAFLASEGLDALIYPTSQNKTSTAITLPGPSRALVNSYSLPYVTVPMGTVTIGATEEPVTIGFMGRYWQDAELLAIAGAYERASQQRVVSTIVPPLEGEVFDYTVAAAPAPEPPATPVVVTVPTVTKPPVAVAPNNATVKGSGKGTRLVFNGKARGPAQIVSVRVSLNGRRIPVKGRGNWTAAISMKELDRFVGRRQDTVGLTVLVRDANGNTNATVKRIRIPRAARA